jgi:hypothetical protein
MASMFCFCAMQAYSADQRLRICNDSNAEVMPQVLYRSDDSAGAEWIAEAPRLLSSAGKCMDVALSPAAEHGYIQVMMRAYPTAKVVPSRLRWQTMFERIGRSKPVPCGTVRQKPASVYLETAGQCNIGRPLPRANEL